MAAITGNVFTSQTPILGLQLYVVVFTTAVFVLLTFILIFLVFLWQRRRSGNKNRAGILPLVCKETDPRQAAQVVRDKGNKVFLIDDVVKELEVQCGSNNASSERRNSSLNQNQNDGGSDEIGYWGRWFSLSELQIATDQFSSKNIIGEGGYGIVYRGVLPDDSFVAVKNLRINKGQAEKEFKVEVEVIGKVRHKNLVGLIGYCAEGAQRYLVYEYVNNGNLEKWLHGNVGPVSPLSWDTRIKIAIGTARGLSYLHEGLEPKVVHRDVKSSNILLDKKWNPKVSDFGLAKLLGSEKSHVTTRVMGTFGYVSPDYASTGMLNEGNDVYSFGVLLMELITGRNPIDYSRPPGEINLVDWFKRMVGSNRGEELVDPLVDVPPPVRSLKRLLLVCLRCIDMDANKRPKMGQILRMLEADEFSYRTEPRFIRDTTLLHPQTIRNQAINAEEGRSTWR